MTSNVQILHASSTAEDFGRAVRNARIGRKWMRQEDAAKLLGMSRRKLIDIEAGRIELAAYERAGIIAVLSPEREKTAPTASERKGCDFMKARGCTVQAQIVRRMFGFPNRPKP